MALTAAYDEIAGWYEQEFLGGHSTGVRTRDRNPLDLADVLRDCSGKARGPAWRSDAAPASTPPRSASWTGPPSASTCWPDAAARLRQASRRA